MSDERLDETIRDALLVDDPGAVPVRLRARMAMIPDESAAPPRDRRRVRLALPAAVLAMATVLAIVFGSLALRGQLGLTSVSSARPSVSPASIGSSGPAPTASPIPGTPAATGSITIDPTQLVGLADGTFALQGTRTFRRWMTDTVSDPLLGWIDMSNSSDARTLVVLTNGHDIASQALTNAGIVWVETWYPEPPITCQGTGCSEHQGQPIAWALNLTTLAGKTTRLDSGVISRIDVGGEGASALAPAMAAQGDRVAYAVPRSRVTGGPEASWIRIRSLADGAVVNTIDTAGYVAQLGILGSTLFYREALGDGLHSGVDPFDSTLYLVGGDGSGVPAELGQHVAAATIGEGGTGDVRIAWTTSLPDDGAIHVSGGDGSGVVAVPPASARMTGAFQPTIIGDGLVWMVWDQNGSGASTGTVLAWRPAWAAPRVVIDLGSPDLILASDGKLLFSGSEVPVLRVLAAPEGAISAPDLLGP